jgi:hypothetical protein
MGAINLSIDQLLLDSENPRIGGADNQRGALQKILDDQEEKLFALAEHVVDEGLSPIDRLLVLREKKGADRFIALEGNRRVAALKILVNPHVLTDLHVKSSLQKRFEALAKRFNRNDVEPVDCFEVSSREEGTQWIYLRHTGENEGRGVVGWSGLAASRFRGGDPALQALEFVRNYGNLDDDQKRLIDHTFPITTLDRLLSTREVRDLIGVAVVERKLRSGLPADEVMRPLKRIVLDLAEKKVNVSKLKNKAEQTVYIQAFDAADKPDLSEIGTLRAIEDIHGGEFKSPAGQQPPVKRRILDPSERRTVVPPRSKLNIHDSKVAAIFKELKKLKIEDFPNAVSVLLRVFLELSVDCYMDSHSMPLRFKNKQNKLVDKTLKQKINEVVSRLVNVEGCDRRDFAGVIRALSVEHSPLYIDLLHYYLHNRFVTPKSRDLIGAWDDAQRFFERIWP